jgi:hypothetical protein
LADLFARFVLGGAIVSLFALAGEVLQPKRFGGMTAAAPSTALATLALTYAQHGRGHVAIEARWMTIGAVAFFVHALAASFAIRRTETPVWLAAAGGWVVWLAVALGLWALGSRIGALT